MWSQAQTHELAIERADHRIAPPVPSAEPADHADGKGRAGIPHCPPSPSLLSAARPSYDGTQDGAFSCCWYPCIQSDLYSGTWARLGRINVACRLYSSDLDSPCSVQPHPLRGFGSRISRNEYPCVIGSQWWRPTSMSYDGPFREGKHPSCHSWYYCARCLCNTGIAMVACCPAAVGVQVL